MALISALGISKDSAETHSQDRKEGHHSINRSSVRRELGVRLTMENMASKRSEHGQEHS